MLAMIVKYAHPNSMLYANGVHSLNAFDMLECKHSAQETHSSCGKYISLSNSGCDETCWLVISQDLDGDLMSASSISENRIENEWCTLWMKLHPLILIELQAIAKSCHIC